MLSMFLAPVKTRIKHPLYLSRSLQLHIISVHVSEAHTQFVLQTSGRTVHTQAVSSTREWFGAGIHVGRSLMLDNIIKLLYQYCTIKGSISFLWTLSGHASSNSSIGDSCRQSNFLWTVHQIKSFPLSHQNALLFFNLIQMHKEFIFKYLYNALSNSTVLVCISVQNSHQTA